jgi:hypothetical protein
MKFVSMLFIFSFGLLSCASANNQSSTSGPGEATVFEATETTEPSVVPPTSTETLIPTSQPSPTAEGQIFREDFTGGMSENWTIDDENPNKWTITANGELQLIADDPSLLIDGNQTNLFWQEIPTGDFQITVHLVAETSSDFQQAAIFIYQDQDNYVTINRGYCSVCEAAGDGIYMDYKLAGSFGNYNVAVTTDDVYLRLVSQDNQIVGYYALEPNAWQRIGRVGNFLQAGFVGLGVSNSDGAHSHDDDLIAFFDYFEITLAE